MMDTTTQMKLLVTLAQADGEVAEREKNYIINIGRAHGISPDHIQPMFNKEHSVIVPSGLTPDEKFDCIYNLVQLMKIDERMYQEEIRFCSLIATKLGYDQEVMFELMLHVRGTSPDDNEKDSLKKSTQKYLKQ